MKFDLMYYLRISYKEMVNIDLAELNWYYDRLREIKDQEVEYEKAKLEAQLMAAGAMKKKKEFGG